MWLNLGLNFVCLAKGSQAKAEKEKLIKEQAVAKEKAEAQAKKEAEAAKAKAEKEAKEKPDDVFR